MSSAWRASLGALLILVAGCPEKFDTADTVGFGSQGSQDGDEGCTPGTEGCGCRDGQCDGELTCASELCVDLGGDSGSSGSASQSGPEPGVGDSSDGDPSDGDTAPSGSCANNSDCPADGVCSRGSGDCVAAYGHTYDVTIAWHGDASVCYDPPSDCTPDPFFYVYFDGTQSWSASAPDVYAANTTPLALAITATTEFAVIVFDENNTGSGTLANGCFVAPPGCPSTIATEFLHAGALQWGESPEYLRVDFLPQ